MSLETFVFLWCSILAVVAIGTSLYAKVLFDREHVQRMARVRIAQPRAEDC